MTSRGRWQRKATGEGQEPAVVFLLLVSLDCGDPAADCGNAPLQPICSRSQTTLPTGLPPRRFFIDFLRRSPALSSSNIALQSSQSTPATARICPYLGTQSATVCFVPDRAPQPAISAVAADCLIKHQFIWSRQCDSPDLHLRDLHHRRPPIDRLLISTTGSSSA